MSVLVWNILIAVAIVAAAMFGLVVAAAIVAVRRKQMHLWLHSYWFPARRQRTPRREDEPVHVFIAVCDHFEPEWGRPDRQTALSRVERWRREYPRLFAQFADCAGRVPQHTFFFPQDEYAPEYLDLLAELCNDGFGDVDVHLHHDGDTEQSLRDKLEEFRDTLAYRHSLLRTDPATGRIVYGFIHGNWALCNSRPDGRWCGVNRELTILRETGCYADFTMPSAPDSTQTRTINSLYYATDCGGSPKSHDCGVHAAVGKEPPADSLLLIQGPLVLDWRDRKGKVFPRIENGDLHANRSPSLSRFDLWRRAGIHVAGRPNWLFVKLHTHGCKTGNSDMLLGEPMQQFHRQLAERASADRNFRYHYVTAWEMAQLVHQAESGAVAPAIGGVALTV
jgi:hypothetical protein